MGPCSSSKLPEMCYDDYCCCSCIARTQSHMTGSSLCMEPMIFTRARHQPWYLARSAASSRLTPWYCKHPQWCPTTWRWVFRAAFSSRLRLSWMKGWCEYGVTDVKFHFLPACLEAELCCIGLLCGVANVTFTLLVFTCFWRALPVLHTKYKTLTISHRFFCVFM